MLPYDRLYYVPAFYFIFKFSRANLELKSGDRSLNLVEAQRRILW
jgi:hypothetical protein